MTPSPARTWIPIHPHTGGASNRARRLAAQLEARGGALYRKNTSTPGAAWAIRAPGMIDTVAQTLREVEGLLLTTKKPCPSHTSPTTRPRTWSAA